MRTFPQTFEPLVRNSDAMSSVIDAGVRREVDAFAHESISFCQSVVDAANALRLTRGGRIADVARHFLRHAAADDGSSRC